MAGSFGRRAIILGGGLAVAGGVSAWRTFAQSRALESRRAADRAPLPEAPAIADLVRYATLAANSHNTQAWRFAPGNGALTISGDPSRRTPVVDPDDHHFYVSLGCAAETLRLSARARGMGGALTVEGDAAPVIVADLSPGAAETSALFDAIPVRQTTRSLFDGSAIDAATANALVSAAQAAGAEAVWVADAARLQPLTDLILTANGAQVQDADFRAELKSWLRFSRGAALSTGDGLFSAASGNPVVPQWIGPYAFDFAFGAETENEKYLAQILSSSGLMVIVAPEDNPRGWIAAGRAVQALTLAATAASLKCAYVNQPVEVAGLRPEVQSLLSLGSARPSLILRIGRAEPMPYSLRRPPEEVIAV